MSFFFEEDQQKRLRIERERREKRELLQRKKDKVRAEKRKAKAAEFQKEIDAEVERMVEENSSDKKKERLQNMRGANLMGSAFFGGGFSGNPNPSGLKSSELSGGLLSLSRSPADLKDSTEPITKVPKLTRPF